MARFKENLKLTFKCFVVSLFPRRNSHFRGSILVKIHYGVVFNGAKLQTNRSRPLGIVSSIIKTRWLARAVTANRLLSRDLCNDFNRKARLCGFSIREHVSFRFPILSSRPVVFVFARGKVK